MRTTVRLDEELLTAAKRLAVETGRTLTAVLEDALREMLARRAAMAESPAVRLPTAGGEGVMPGVDLEDWSTVKDVLDEER